MKNIKIRVLGVKQEDMLHDTKVAEASLEKAYLLNELMFPGTKPQFKLVLCYTRKSYDGELKRRTQRWESGMSNKKRIITFAPSVYNRITNNKMGFYQVVLHETNHIFYMNFVGAFTPQWLMEGVASLVDGSDKYYKWTGKPDINSLAFSLKGSDRRGKKDFDITEFYRSSYLATKRIVNEIGVKRLISLLKEYSKQPIKKNYERLFYDFLHKMQVFD